ncbi:F-box/kelch-repeat protein [Camellia lanceoleosa]|uniref:F-box/kelch-repeat protein n=1 Tax=Camellia lanceoleosa TaxID=1840588 RepID=A0ACC0FZI7_9ERIC|nr:F-box/kelch-repeat protein [Camellia lanceoleosa]
MAMNIKNLNSNKESLSPLFFTIGSVKGLFCLHEQDWYFLWNPSIRKSMAMPKPTVKTSMHSHGFGFDPRTNDYKLVRIADFYPTKLPSQSQLHTLRRAVHFAAKMKKSNDPLILSFDLCDEVFQTMMLPDGVVAPRTEVRASDLGIAFSLILCISSSIDLSRGITQVLGIRNNGHILLETKAPSDWVLSSYDPSSQQTKNLGIYATSNHFVVDTYKENLILLNKPNDAFSRRQRRNEVNLHLKEIKEKVEEAKEVSKNGASTTVKSMPNSRLFFCKCNPLIFQAITNRFDKAHRHFSKFRS